MTLVDTYGGQTTGRGNDSGQKLLPPARDEAGQSGLNVGDHERMASVAAGAILAAIGVARQSVPGIIVAAVGGALIYRGATGHCALYAAADIDTAHPRDAGAGRSAREIIERGIRVEQAFLVNRPAADLYAYWRNFENLPRIMTYLDSVRVIDERRSHWVAKAPAIAGGKVEWDAEITRDDVNELIAWRSVGDAEVESVGQVRFAKALGDRGTEVHVSMSYVPPAGKLGHLIAKMFGKDAKKEVREGLRNFKQVMEAGEAPTIIGQSHGTCTGRGERYSD